MQKKKDRLDLSKRIDPMPERYDLIQVDPLLICSALEHAPPGFIESDFSKSTNRGVRMMIPMPNGEQEEFEIWESSIMQEGLQAKFPEIRTYKGVSVKDRKVQARFSMSPLGFDATIKKDNKIFFIKPFVVGDNINHLVYHRKSLPNETFEFACYTDDALHLDKDAWRPENGNPNYKNSGGMYEIRLAIAATGEYTAYMGGSVSNAMAGIVNGVNSCNLILELEVNTRMILVNNNDALIYTNSSSDPYSGNDHNFNINANQPVVDNTIGPANYDLGHLVCRIPGGWSWVGIVCSSENRARSASYLSNSDYETLIHEFGHSLNASHSFNSNHQYCVGARINGAAYEPGSGSTMMSYAWRCGFDNVQEYRDYYFHVASLEYMAAHLEFAACISQAGPGNTAPTFTAIDDYTIPRNTPFILSGTATDPNGDDLTYCWEQHDLGPGGYANQPVDNAPIFRSWAPTSDNFRVFPRYSDLLNNNYAYGEKMPDYTRQLVFHPVVRDNNPNGGCFDIEEVVLQVVSGAGPFEVSSQNQSTNWTAGGQYNIQWVVANTDDAPVNCGEVDIILLTEGEYPGTQYILAQNVPNDGSQPVVIPAVQTTEGRIMVKCSDNIFFDINNADITIQGASGPSFMLQATTIDNDICTAQQAEYEIALGSLMNYSGPVTISVNGLPNDASFSLSDYTPNAPQNLSLWIAAGPNTPAGTYDIAIQATDGNQIESFNVSLTVSLYPSTPVLGYPGSAVTDFPDGGVLDWSDAYGADMYEIEVATDASFNNIVSAGMSVMSQFELTGTNLNTTYFWRVRGLSSCGSSAFTSPSSFVTTNAICGSMSSVDIPVFILHQGTYTYFSELNWTGSGTITDVNIKDVQGTHNYLQDLTFSVISPSGTELIMVQGQCGHWDDFNVNWDSDINNNMPCPYNDGGTYSPVMDLSAFNGEDANGIWKLKIVDSASPHGGKLNNWGLDICTTIPSTGTNGTVQVSLKAMLEGAYDSGGSMNNVLGANCPMNQPYNVDPYFYGGNESMTVVSSQMVDWILVEAREGTPSMTGTRTTTTVETVAGILLTNGEIVAPDGFSPLGFNNLTAQQSYYFVLRHRNHLDVMTSTPIVVGSNMIYDFSISASQSLGLEQQKMSNDGRAMMYAGDYNSDGTIQNTDFDAWNSEPALINVYESSDGNLDGTIQTTDFDLWNMNKATVGIIEIMY